MGGVMSYEGFYAIHDHMPGGDDALRVGGTVVFRTGGWSAELREHEKTGPTGINPNIFYADLVLTAPAEGTGVKSPEEEPRVDTLKVEHPA